MFKIFEKQLAAIVKGNADKSVHAIEEDDKLIKFKIITPFNSLDISKEDISSQRKKKPLVKFNNGDTYEGELLSY